MPLGDRVLDLGLNVLDVEATHLELCSALPTTYAAATTTNNLGTANLGAGNVAGAPAAGSPNGRKVTVAAVTGTTGTVATGGTASHIAITDRTNSRLLHAQALSANKTVNAGDNWTSPAFDISIPNS